MGKQFTLLLKGGRFALMFLLLFVLGNESVFATYSANSKLGSKQEEVMSEKGSKLEESRIWGKTTTSESNSNMFEDVMTDEDTKLQAPPPGETGNPQKIPLNGMDAAFLLLLSGFYLGYIRKKNMRTIN